MSTSLVVVHADDSLLLAWESMSAAGVHHLPVLERGRLLGIVGERDMAVQWVIGPLAQQRRQIRELIRRPPIQVGPDDDLRHVADCMGVSDTDAVAVTERDGSLQGLITARDVLAAVAGTSRFGRIPLRHRGDAATLFRLVPAALTPAASPNTAEDDRAVAVTT